MEPSIVGVARSRLLIPINSARLASADETRAMFCPEPAATGSVSLNGALDRGTAISNTPYSPGFLFNNKDEINFFKGDRFSFTVSRFTRDF